MSRKQSLLGYPHDWWKSCLRFDYVLAFGAYLIVNQFEGRRSLKGVFAYAAVIMLPLYFLIKEKHIPSFIMFGLAFAFKLQSIFLLLLFIFVYFTRRNFSVLTFACSISSS